MIIARKIEWKRKRSDKNCQWLKNEKENCIMHTTNIKEEIKEKWASLVAQIVKDIPAM